MPKRSSIAMFIAATSALSIVITEDISLKAGENDMGGLKEWNTDMPVNSDFILDDAAQKLADEAAKSSTCIPILSLIHISEPTRPYSISYSVFCL